MVEKKMAAPTGKVYAALIDPKWLEGAAWRWRTQRELQDPQVAGRRGDDEARVRREFNC